MALSDDDIHKIAHLARLNISKEEVRPFANRLSNILDFVNQMNEADTQDVAAISHALDLTQRLRTDAVTETDQHEAFQRIAPAVEAGLYLVPKVIESV
jgi:aspartyl-tRNA(Asn)/glutamyl-tRNA(Gln) amidotransferase subunit C